MEMRGGTGLAVMAALVLLDGSAVTLHRSFRSREVGLGGGVGVSVPVDTRVSAAIDEGRAEAAKRARILVGRVTSVNRGDEFCLVTGGGTLVVVRMDRIEAPAVGQPHGQESADYLRKLIRGRQVRVECRQDDQGRVQGLVTLGKTDVNRKLVAAGMARVGGLSDRPSDYDEAEAAAKAAKKGLWTDAAE